MMKRSEKNGKNTLLWSVIMSAPGPLIVGLGLLAGKSSTQMADFVRRSAELMAIIVSYVVYAVTTKDSFDDINKKQRLEKNTDIFVGGAMILGGIMMIVSSFVMKDTKTGNVIPGLAVAILGVVANSIFFVRYSRLAKESSNSILLVQSRLYGAKTLVDSCVSIALMSIVFFPDSSLSYFLDKAGTYAVCAYLIYTGMRTIIQRTK